MTALSSNVGNIENIELIRNIAFLFGRQTVSVSCGLAVTYRQQILHIWSGSGVVEN